MSQQRKRIAIDFDDTICKSFILKRVNEFLGTNYKIDYFKQFLIDDIIPEDRRKEFFETLFETDPYERVQLIKGAKEALKLLNEKYDIYICSSCIMVKSPKNSAQLFAAKYDYLIRNLPFLDPKKFIFTSSKHMINADIMIDDYFSNLKNDVPVKYLFETYHNKELPEEELQRYNVKRVKDWDEICSLLL